MRFLLLSSLIAACGAFTACGGGDGTVQAQSVQGGEAPASYAVTLRGTEPLTIAAEALTLQLATVEDSRCPINALCVWAGQGVVSVTATQAGQAAETVRIGLAGGPVPNAAAYRAFRLTLTALEPAPVSTQAVAPEQYRATLRVERP